MIRLLLALALLWAPAAHAQNIMCPTRAPGNNSNACASTAFVGAAQTSALATALPSQTNCQLYTGTGAAGVAGAAVIGTGLNCASGTLSVTGSGSSVAAGGRLTLQSGVQVMTTSQTGKTTIYYITYTGNTVPVYTGSADIAANITSNQMSLTLQSSGAGVTNSNSVFDIWDYYNSGTPVLCVATNGSGGGWASDTGGSNTARGTGYSQLDRTTRSYPTNANALANCYNGSTNYGSIGANQATYLGSVCTDAASAGQVSYTFGGAASGGSAARFCVWNNWNRHLTTTNVIDNGASYGYSSSTIQAARASNTNRVTYLMGLPEDAIETKSAMVLQLAAIAFDYSNTGICVDSTSAFFNVSSFLETPTATALIAAAYQPNSIAPQTGLHFIQQCQAANNVNTTTFDYSSNDSLEVTIWN